MVKGYGKAVQFADAQIMQPIHGADGAIIMKVCIDVLVQYAAGLRMQIIHGAVGVKEMQQITHEAAQLAEEVNQQTTTGVRGVHGGNIMITQQASTLDGEFAADVTYGNQIE